jgi:hypothetical protein
MLFQIEEMEDELNAVSKSQSEQHLQIQEARAKMTASINELAQERKKVINLVRKLLQTLERIYNELL